MTYNNKEAVMRWREKNKEKYREIKKECQKRYYEKNKEVFSKRKAEWYRKRTQRINELESELEYVRTIKDSAEKTLKEVREENRILKKNISWYEKEEDRLREENKKLKEENKRLSDFLECEA